MLFLNNLKTSPFPLMTGGRMIKTKPNTNVILEKTMNKTF